MSEISVTRKISVKSIGSALYDCIAKASFEWARNELEALGRPAERDNTTAREILDQLLGNAEIARCELRPLCQDTGLAVVFVDIGQSVALIDGDLTEAINSPSPEPNGELYLRKSVVRHALTARTRRTTRRLSSTRELCRQQGSPSLSAKGGGLRNMSQLAMLDTLGRPGGCGGFVFKAVRDALPILPPISGGWWG